MGSGNYKALDTNSEDFALPSYKPTSGIGAGLPEEINHRPSYRVTIAQALSNTVVNQMQLIITKDGTDSTFALQETGATTGIFQDSSQNTTFTLNPVIQTSSSVVDKLQAVVSCNSLSLSNQSVPLLETELDSKEFESPEYITQITLGGNLSTGSADTMQVQLFSPEQSRMVVESLVETGVNTKVFHNTAQNLTVSLSGYSSLNASSPDTLQAEIDNGILEPTGLLATPLKETGNDTKVFTNLELIPTDITPETPASNGQAIFRIRMRGFDPTLLKANITAGSDPKEIGFTQQADGSLMTDPISLISEAGFQNYSGIQGIKLAAAATTVSIAVNLKESSTAPAGSGFQLLIEESPVRRPALIANCLTKGELQSGSVGQVPQYRGFQLLKTMELIFDKDLGWASTIIPKFQKNQLSSIFEDNEMLYWLAHGGTNGDPIDPRLNRIKVHDTQGKGGFAFVRPIDIRDARELVEASQEEPRKLKLVFMAACSGAKDSEFGQPNMDEAFDSEAYISYSNPVFISSNSANAALFFKGMSAKDSQTGKPFQAGKMVQLLATPEMVIRRGSNVRIMLNPTP